ncbi:MAG: hypothetical protein HWE26_13825 [Alteromonadaceae bacterium]|nr:hypothetical protein [Alteromonadaceae bacterium]
MTKPKPKITPQFLRQLSAALYLDMTVKEFLAAVADGRLPPAGPFDRWDKDALDAAMRGTATDRLFDDQDAFNSEM